jgi:hypothetical protein
MISSKAKTTSRTYRFFEVDIEKMLTLGESPKHVFRLGIYSIENNPHMLARINELEQQNKNLAEKLQRYAKRVYELEKEI